MIESYTKRFGRRQRNGLFGRWEDEAEIRTLSILSPLLLESLCLQFGLHAQSVLGELHQF